MEITAAAIDGFIQARKARPKWAGVPAAIRPKTVEDGYRMQKAVYDRLAADGVTRAGYKVGSTSAAGQKLFGLTEPVYAGLFEQTHFPTMGAALASGFVAPAVELEIVVTLLSDIDGANPSRAEVAAAIASCHLGCEIIDHRYGDPMQWGLPTLIVDDFFNGGFVVGAANPKWKDLDLAKLDAEIVLNGKSAETGNSANVLYALDSVRWLAGKLALQGTKIRAGEIVFTGSIIPPMKTPAAVNDLEFRLQGFAPLNLKGG